MKKILIAPDSFKGSLSAYEICEILKDEFLAHDSKLEIESCPMADGGEGSAEILADYLSLQKVYCDTVDPLGREMTSVYYASNDAAYIELASASGLVLLDQPDRNPLQTSTYGTGLMINDAINKGAQNIYLFLGGSATNDGGIGIADALGFHFLDETGQKLKPTGKSLNHIRSIKAPSEMITVNIHLCCDVTNVPYGLQGASHIYAKQKGANPEEIKLLDQGVKNLCDVIQPNSQVYLEKLKGGGAAGAVAVSLVGLINASIISGIDFISTTTELKSKIQNADVVITGEGRLDHQSMNGKVIKGVSDLCKELDKTLYAVAGQNTLNQDELMGLGIKEVFTISELAADIDDAMGNSRFYMSEIGKMIGDRF